MFFNCWLSVHLFAGDVQIATDMQQSWPRSERITWGTGPRLRLWQPQTTGAHLQQCVSKFLCLYSCIFIRKRRIRVRNFPALISSHLGFQQSNLVGESTDLYCTFQLIVRSWDKLKAYSVMFKSSVDISAITCLTTMEQSTVYRLWTRSPAWSHHVPQNVFLVTSPTGANKVCLNMNGSHPDGHISSICPHLACISLA
jgi:hypothetical protein